MSERQRSLRSRLPACGPAPLAASDDAAAPLEQTVVGYGLRVGLRANERDGLEVLRGGLPGEWKASANGGATRWYSLVADDDAKSRYALFRDDFELVRSSDLERVLESLVGSAGFYFAEHSRHRTFIHAGAVAWQDRAILLPGRQSSGKTTLTAALVRAGATYLSDDFAPIDDRGRVHPFPRPLSVRREHGRPPRLTPVEALGGVQERRALPVGLVVLAPYTGARRWSPRPLAPGNGVLGLLAYTASAQTRPRQALERLGRVATAAPVLKGGRGEADETARLILKRLSSVAASL